MSRMLIEAESFKNLGGWVVDQRSMNVMGSSYIMAHGMGTPVPDATTYAEFPETAKWYAWVRTRDWTAVWKRGSAAGIFRLNILKIHLEITVKSGIGSLPARLI